MRKDNSNILSTKVNSLSYRFSYFEILSIINKSIIPTSLDSDFIFTSHSNHKNPPDQILLKGYLIE